MVAVDHDSKDGTTEILRTWEREGHLCRIPRSGPFQEIEWRTGLARMAASDFGADWVINGDADLFWWPRDGDLKEVLAAVPSRYGVVHSVDRVFVARPDDGAHFVERMTARLVATAPINAPVSTFRPLGRIVHRADPHVRVSRGGHSISGASLRSLRAWYPVEVLHFPWRSPAQLARKAGNWHLARDQEAGPHLTTAYHDHAHRAVQEGGVLGHYARLAVDDDELRRGLESGVLVTDTRLRDALRVLDGRQTWEAPDLRSPLVFPPPSVSEEAEYAAEAAALGEAQLVRVRRRLDLIEGRVATLESRVTLAPRARRRP